MDLELPDGGRLHYETLGTRGPWLVLLNGLMMSTASWEPLAPTLARAGRLLRFDLRDQGRSSALPPGYRAEQHVADACLLFDHLGIERAHVLGVSYGGQVALAMQARSPERIASLVLASVVPRASAYLSAVGAAWRVAARRQDAAEFFDLCMPYVYGPSFYERAGEWLAARKAALGPLLHAEWFARFDRLAQSAAGFDYDAVLEHICVPTTLICGSHDLLTPAAEMRRMASRIEGAVLLELPDAGHGAVLEQPQAFCSAVLGHIARC